MPKMRPLKALLSFEKATEIIAQNIKPLDAVETIPLDSALNRVLAQDIIAEHEHPPFDRAAMDGYAVRAEDTYGAGTFKPRILKRVGSVFAGEVPNATVTEGTCVQIATGAMLPEGADAVVMVEETEAEADGDQVNIFKPAYPRAHVSGRGEDIALDTTLLKPGVVLTPARIGLLASQGLTEVQVYRQPRVAIMPTGDEVAPVGQELRVGQVYDINSHTIGSIITLNGGLSQQLGVIVDDYETLKQACQQAMANDLIVLSGGSSVGERDMLVDVFSDLGEVYFHGVQVKPGKPLLFGRVGDTPIFGLPGYPTACLTSGYLFVAPTLRILARLPEHETKTVRKTLARRVVSTLGRLQFLTVRVEGGLAVPVFKESGAITSISEADGYILIPANVDLVEKDESVEVRLFH